MATRGITLPARLRKDSIIEALLEIRFDMATVPEVLFGRLASYSGWKSLQQRRLPAYNVPANIRQIDPNLKFQSIFELADPQTKRAIRIGPQVLSFHVLPPYIGWQAFRAELNEAIEQLFSSSEELSVIRLGLRYINALTPKDHFVNSLYDLDLDIKVANERLEGKTNLNFLTESNDFRCVVRIATTNFVQGILPEGTTLVIDVDVSTKDDLKANGKEDLKDWIDRAHTKEKEEFFHLLPDNLIQKLKED